jgi:V8-like Glu-specific endopeptidase
VLAELHVLTGARAGATYNVTTEITVGRAPGLGLQFDPDRDLDVSGRHAVIVHSGGRWILRDLGSRNGTFVNDRRVSEADLVHGDRIRFGTDGPEVEFRTQEGSAAAPASGARPGTAAALVKSNRRLRLLVSGLAIALIVAVAIAIRSGGDRIDWELERQQLLSRIDSTLATGDQTVAALTGEREDIATALRESQEEVRRLRGELEQAEDEGAADDADLRRQLQSAIAALDRQQLAASIDHATIESLTRRAVAVVWVQHADNTVTTGTAFAVRPDGTLATSRHVLQGPDEQLPPERIGVQFADSRQVWPARILGLSEDADVAIIRVDNILGDVPTVAGLNLRTDTLATGTPIAWLGFPLGGETWPQDAATGRIARPVVAVGVITGLGRERIDLQAYGAEGASGSPVLDESGSVIAVLIGGTGTDRDRRLVAVPAALVNELLRSVASEPALSPR